MTLSNVSVSAPNGRPLITNLSLTVPPHGLLIRGPSGCGKSSLLRAIAGLWPSTGQIVLPDAGVVFVPQIPYAGSGGLISLREALLYPHTPQAGGGSNSSEDESLMRVIRETRLEKAVSALGVGLDTPIDLHTTLSVGEQQRLAFARLILAAPKVAVLDEATSALDEASEAAMYTLLHTHSITPISVGHRSTLVPFHESVVDL